MTLCSAEGCCAASRRKGMCPKHYRRWHVASPDTPRCSKPGCLKASRAAGLCENHYGQQRRQDTTRPRCQLQGCERVVEAKALCYPHYATARRYNLTATEFAALIEQHGSACAVCGDQSPSLYVDHDHSSGAVRGLLCATCNFMLGHAKNSPDLLLAGAAYLLQTQNVLVFA